MSERLQVPFEEDQGLALEPIGVIDIGSNSVRLVVYEGAVRAPTPIFNEKELCGLGKSLSTTGRLSEVSVGQAIATLNRFRAIARVLSVKNIRAFATAAVRDAANGDEFIRAARQACGVDIHVLSGAREAELAAFGINMGFNDPDGVAGDLGGGSLELVDLMGKVRRDAVSLPLGGLRMIDVTENRIERAAPLAQTHLDDIGWLKQGTGRPFYAVGGTWRSVAKLHMAHTNYPLRVMQGYTIPTDEAIAFCEMLQRKKLTSIPGFEHVSRARRDVLPFGAATLEHLLRRVQPSKLVFSVHGIREGVVFDLLTDYEQQKDPLLTFSFDYARKRSRSARHAVELCSWTDELFDNDDPQETPEERRLRYAACLLSDIGWREHPDYRGDQSLNLIAHAALSGIDHPGRLFLALTVYFRHAGAGESSGEGLSAALRACIDRNALRRARILAAAIRAAHMLSMGQSGIVPQTPLSFAQDKLILTIPGPYASLDGDRLRRRFDTLAKLVGRRLEVNILG